MMRLSPHRRFLAAALVSLSAACLASCGGSNSEETAGNQPQAQSKAQRSRPTQKVDLDMVSAPTAGKTLGAVNLKFAVTQKPAVGQPVDIRLALIPNTGIQRLVGTFTASDGLELRSGGKTPMFENPEAGASINHTLTVVPSHDGIFYVTAVVLSESETTSLARTFTIPLIAGVGLSASTQPPNAATPTIARAPAAKSRQSQ